MALANSRPMQIPNMESDLIHNTTSPVFQPTSLMSPLSTTSDISMNMGMNIPMGMAMGMSIDPNDVNNSPNSINSQLLDHSTNDLMSGINSGNGNGTDMSMSMSMSLGLSPVSLDMCNGIKNKNGNNNLITPQQQEANAKATASNKKKDSSKKDGTNNSKDNNGSSSNAGPNNIMIELSKMIPVTGERPKPTDRSEPLDDDVLYAVFLILWEIDADQQGMTVKQICDHLLTRHPEMSNLSTKLSNLISAKLNAYVKKTEKGEKTMKYALSREWSNSSPRRMLYMYRGILSENYKEHALAASEKLKKQQELMGLSAEKKKAGSIDLSADSPLTDMSSSSETSINGGIHSNGSVDPAAMPFSKDMNNGFTFSPDFNIPYSTSPVSVNLSPAVDELDGLSPTSTPRKLNVSKKMNKNDESTKGNLKTGTKNGTDNQTVSGPASKKQKIKSSSSSASFQQLGERLTANGNDKNSSSGGQPSANLSLNAIRHSAQGGSSSGSNYITAAAAAPRLSRSASRGSFKSSSQASASALAAIQKVISTQLPIEFSQASTPSVSRSSSSIGGSAGGKSPTSSTSSVSSGGSNITTPSGDESTPKNIYCTNNFSYEHPANAMWFKIVREGFLTSDIDPPESLSLEDLENIMS